MDIAQKRCLIASTAMHGFLFLLLVFGSAFFVAHQKPLDYSNLRVIPSRFVDGPAGGGGIPNLPDTNEKQKGDPNAEQTVQTKPKPPRPDPPVRTVEPKPVEAVKPTTPTVPNLNLKPVTRKNPPDKSKAEAVDLKPTKNSAKSTSKADNARAAREAGAKLAQQLAKTKEGLQRGSAKGTAVNVHGEGGEAYAPYSHLVKEIYDDAWVVALDLSLDSGVAVVKVTIARDGRVIRAVISERSGQRALDVSVQQALDKVTKLPPFPEAVKDDQRTFIIKFDLEGKRSEA